MSVTAALVKELREKSGAGMMDCKKALSETDGDMEAAIDWLRTKGLATAAKKSGRIASEGLVAFAVDGTRGALIELNAETDFVARNTEFQEFASTLATLALAADDIEALGGVDYPDTGRNVSEELTHKIATIGENMSLRRMESVSVGSGSVVSYMHNSTAPGLGRIGVLVALESSADKAVLEELGKQIAMHIAATSPASLSVDDLDPESVQRERDVLIEQAKASGKPQEIAEKMVEGRMKKYYQEVVLLEQTSVIDGETQIAGVVANAAKSAGTDIELTAFARFNLGEGIEKEETDFAAEVAAQLS
ncbi:MAG TPA: elongation factor Ts [Alphaproteobacteria bacterium]|jgi:elongation factor Ts|nr:MAG: elongation factor Ts [SAR116 cluster bacterium MED-G05]HBD51693.1 elongation factor Ts [Alphaproteobacteria bacterium]HCA14234.1 elongation factor Ts [Alphaproteobacteria bacterium]HCA91561.1 elongation factor Ts [Alphaproteobacteria bacterium]HCD22159.1 elongation factor Ts [Alphaproteobacteria bacterium]|tara:strand:- start:614 stop:1531 length:918 start_codon:yes stop_codon:yes gene_type:complete